MVQLDYTFERQLELEREDSLEEGMALGMDIGLDKGLAALVTTLKTMLPDFESVYSAIVKNADYANRTREEVQKYYN